MERSSNSKIVMCGCLETGWEMVRFLLEKGIKISYFVTIDKEKAEQRKVAGYESFEDLALRYKIPIYRAHSYSLKSDKDVEFFKGQKFDLLIQGGWQRLFPKEVLDTLSIGAVGIHGSSEFLPKGRGRSPINWSIIEDKKRFIMHYFIIKPGIDDGDVFYYESFDINEWDTCRTLYYKNSIITKRVMFDWIPRLLKNNYNIIPQSGEPTYYPKRTAEDGLINWDNDVFQIYNFIRALTTPYPGAFTYVNGIKLEIWKAQPFDSRITYYGHAIGEVVEIFRTGDLLINCNGGLLLITDYKIGIPVEIGDLLGLENKK
jgi:methionyl-tRNA formyltransferase